MPSRRIKHHRVASGSELDQPFDIPLQNVVSNEEDTQNLLLRAQARAVDVSHPISSQPAHHKKATVTTLEASDNLDHDHAAENRLSINARKLWVPVFLRRRTLSIFATSFVLLLAILVLLWQISKKRNGLSAVHSQYYYIWTYGPTAGRSPLP